MKTDDVVYPDGKAFPFGFSVSSALRILRYIDRDLAELRKQAALHKKTRDCSKCRDMLLAALDYAKVLREIALLEIRHHDLVVQIERDQNVDEEFVSALKETSCGFDCS